MPRILVCFGTRPEYIKLKSIIENCNNIKTCFTGQHLDLVKNVKVDYTINYVKELDNRLNDIHLNILRNPQMFDGVDYVLVQGDTTTSCAIAISAFNHHKKIIHLEAGLRSNDIMDPYPEEANRQIISRLAYINLCPTEFNRQNLVKENTSGENYVIGQSGLDSISKDGCEYGNSVLITMHRRDNIPIMDKWFIEIEKIAVLHPELNFVIPLHPNPDVSKHKHLFNKVNVIEAMNHSDLISFVKKCRFVISDSGGLQEECSYLNKKIIVCRKTTERPESIGLHSIMCNSPSELMDIVEKINTDFMIDEECPYYQGLVWKKFLELDFNKK